MEYRSGSWLTSLTIWDWTKVFIRINFAIVFSAILFLLISLLILAAFGISMTTLDAIITEMLDGKS